MLRCGYITAVFTCSPDDTNEGNTTVFCSAQKLETFRLLHKHTLDNINPNEWVSNRNVSA